MRREQGVPPPLLSPSPSIPIKVVKHQSRPVLCEQNGGFPSYTSSSPSRFVFFPPAVSLLKRSRRVKILSPPPSRFEKWLISETGSFYKPNISRNSRAERIVRLEKSNPRYFPLEMSLVFQNSLRKKKGGRATDETAWA